MRIVLKESQKKEVAAVSVYLTQQIEEYKQSLGGYPEPRGLPLFDGDDLIPVRISHGRRGLCLRV